jgi:hypothetical protein
VPPSLAFGAPVVDAPGPGELHMLEDWAAWSNASKTTLLPQLDAPGVLLPVKLVEKTSGTEALRVEVVVNAEHGYQVADPVPRTVADLLGGIVLEPSGVLTPKDAKPRIDVYAQDRTLHLLSMELGGVPNLKKSPTDGYALAALQTYLAAKGEYKGDIDGEWGSKSRTALNKLAAAYGCNKDDRYPELVARLMEPEDDE